MAKNSAYLGVMVGLNDIYTSFGADVDFELKTKAHSALLKAKENIYFGSALSARVNNLNETIPFKLFLVNDTSTKIKAVFFEKGAILPLMDAVTLSDFGMSQNKQGVISVKSDSFLLNVKPSKNFKADLEHMVVHVDIPKIIEMIVDDVSKGDYEQDVIDLVTKWGSAYEWSCDITAYNQRADNDKEYIMSYHKSSIYAKLPPLLNRFSISTNGFNIHFDTEKTLPNLFMTIEGSGDAEISTTSKMTIAYATIGDQEWKNTDVLSNTHSMNFSMYMPNTDAEKLNSVLRTATPRFQKEIHINFGTIGIAQTANSFQRDRYSMVFNKDTKINKILQSVVHAPYGESGATFLFTHLDPYNVGEYSFDFLNRFDSTTEVNRPKKHEKEKIESFNQSIKVYEQYNATKQKFILLPRVATANTEIGFTTDLYGKRVFVIEKKLTEFSYSSVDDMMKFLKRVQNFQVDEIIVFGTNHSNRLFMFKYDMKLINLLMNFLVLTKIIPWFGEYQAEHLLSSSGDDKYDMILKKFSEDNVLHTTTDTIEVQKIIADLRFDLDNKSIISFYH